MSKKRELKKILKNDYDDNINYRQYLPDQSISVPKKDGNVIKYNKGSALLKTIKNVAGGAAIGAGIGAISGAAKGVGKAIIHESNPDYHSNILGSTLSRATIGGVLGGGAGGLIAANDNSTDKTVAILSNVDKKDIENINQANREFNSIREMAYAPARKFYSKHKDAIEEGHRWGDEAGSSSYHIYNKYNDLNDKIEEELNKHPLSRRKHSLENKAIYDALKRYHKIASEELDSMYKQAFFGGPGDAVMFGTTINDLTKKYNKAAGGMTGMARQKAGWGAVAGGIGKSVAKGAILGAGAQVAANAIDNITKPTQEDEYGRRVVASEVLDEMWKEALLGDHGDHGNQVLLKPKNFTNTSQGSGLGKSIALGLGAATAKTLVPALATYGTASIIKKDHERKAESATTEEEKKYHENRANDWKRYRRIGTALSVVPGATYGLAAGIAHHNKTASEDLDSMYKEAKNAFNRFMDRVEDIERRTSTTAVLPRLQQAWDKATQDEKAVKSYYDVARGPIGFNKKILPASVRERKGLITMLGFTPYTGNTGKPIQSKKITSNNPQLASVKFE